MKYTKLFRQHSEYVAYTASTSFIRPNVSYCILEDEPHCTPSNLCPEGHTYEVVGSPSYPQTVPASATSFEMSFTYNDIYTTVACEQTISESSSTVTIEIEENLTYSARTVSGVYVFQGNDIVYSLIQEACAEQPYSASYLTFDILTGGTLAWTAKNNLTKTISYSINNGAWTDITSTAEGAVINVSTGDKVRFKGSNSKYGTAKDTCSSFSSGSTASYNVEGNIMSLIGGDNFTGLTSFNNETYVFHSLFDGSKVISAEHLILPVTTLTNYCYRAMFANCKSLTVAPELPATTLARGCYWYMFSYSKLTTAPELNAETLVQECYGGMFRNSTMLNYIKCMATSGLNAASATTMWVGNVASSGTFFKNENTTWTIGDNGIPTNWTVEYNVQDPIITCNGRKITIECASQDAAIHYRLDHIGAYELYSEPIEITADTFVESYAVLNSITSNTVSQSCTYRDYNQDYLTFNITSGGTIRWNAYGSGYEKVIQYSKNDGEWTTITAGSSTNISVNANDVVRFKGTNSTYAGSKANYAGFDSGGTAVFNIEGNIMSLIYGDNFTGQTAMTGTYNLCSIFKTANVVSAENLILPSTSLTNYCYRAMFSLCPKLTIPPELPATTLSQGCYWYMFEQCPMTTAPVLPAKTLVKECYGNMFINCSSLNYIKCLATTGFSASSVLTDWVKGVSSNGTFVKDGNTAVESGKWTLGNSGIPTNWVVTDDGTPDVPSISTDGFEIELSCSTTGADIYYKLNHGGSYSAYTTAITMTGDTFIECYSEKDGYSSTTTSMTCEFDDRTIFEYSNESLDTWTRSGSAVTLPNSVNAVDGHSSNYAKGTYNYETSVNLRSPQPTYLWFQHADQTATIFVDNVEVEKHWGGYNAFFSDISGYVHKGTNNIKVALKNNEGNVLAPYTGDFNFNATLGKVKLFTSPYLPAMTYGYDGFHITSTVSTGSAIINVATNIPTGATVVCTISGTNCNYTASSASTGGEMIFTTTVTNPHLWNGTIDPYLYNVKLEIYHDNELYHRYERGYGLRFYEYVINETVNGNTYTGFLLNGSPYLLRGCCMHDDIAGKANALNDADYTQQFNLLSDLGLNFLRLAHYPHPKEVYDKCDQLGIIVETEVPCVNHLQSTMPNDYYTHLVGQYDDMVNQHYNHPCIVFWGLSNEAKVTDSTEGRAFAKSTIETYVTQIKALDSERMVGLVGHALTDPISYFGGPTNIDWIGSNLYEGWYQNQTSNNPTTRLNTCISNTITRESVPYAFSEYGCGGTQRCHSDSPSSTTNKGSGGARHDIEYEMWLHEGHIAAIKNKPELLFTSQWVLFDFAVANRNEGYTVCLDGVNTSIDDNLRRLNDKGLVERDHVTKKDVYYLYKAWWNQTDKFVHICGKNYNKARNRVIKCYTNESGSLSLYVNNNLVATASVTNNICEFASMSYNHQDVITVSGANSSDSFTLIDPYNGYDYVEIGGLKWATMNVGATGVTDYGLYFQWGDTSGYTASQVGNGSGQKKFSWEDYKFWTNDSGSGSSGITKYNSGDGKRVLDLSDDAARAHMGGIWRMPTTDELVTLGQSVDTTWVNDYQESGISGRLLTDKTDNSKQLFLPACGICYGGSIHSDGDTECNWSSSLKDNIVYAFYLYGGNFQDDGSRFYGQCVRGVAE